MPFDDDQGFTLVEVLIAVTILGMIMSAIAAAVIFTIDTTKSTSNRLSDSVDSQITSAYFVRDVQGAGYITTDANLALVSAAPFLTLTPQVCGPSSVIGAGGSLSGYKLLVAMYHPPASGGTALASAYWQVGSVSPYQILRYSCTVSIGNNGTTSAIAGPIPVVIADNVSSASSPAIIQPSQFQTAAASGWVPTVASTTVQDVSGSTVTVAPSTTGFLTSGTCGVFVSDACVKVVTSFGSKIAGCNSASNTTFTCASGGPTIQPQDTLTQDSVQAINIAVSQSPSSLQTGAGTVEYHYRLAAAPRTQSAWGAGPGTSPVGPNPGGGSPPCVSALTCLPTLLVDGSTGVCLTGGTSLTVTGTAYLDSTTNCNGGSAPVNCSGGSTFTSSSGTFWFNPGGTSTNCGTTGATGFVKNPLSGVLPNCFSQQPLSSTSSSGPQPVSGKVNTFEYQPGRYTSTIPPSTGTFTQATFYFAPGVYELDGGISVGTQQVITIDPTTQTGPSPPGMLLYVPGPAAAGENLDCASSSSNPSVNLGAQGTGLDLPPITLTQITDNTAWGLNQYSAGMWLWQDASNSNSSSLAGGSTAASNGLAYLPSSVVTLAGGAGAPIGSLVCAGINLVGGSTVKLSG